MEDLRWENDENILLQRDESNGQPRSRALFRASPSRTPLLDVTHLFPSDALSALKLDYTRRRAGQHERSRRHHVTPVTRKRRALQPDCPQGDRQAALLRKIR